jgi:hypothetical protein
MMECLVIARPAINVGARRLAALAKQVSEPFTVSGVFFGLNQTVEKFLPLELRNNFLSAIARFQADVRKPSCRSDTI